MCTCATVSLPYLFEGTLTDCDHLHCFAVVIEIFGVSQTSHGEGHAVLAQSLTAVAHRRADPSRQLASHDALASNMQAVRRRHSTTEEALEVAASSGAYRTILTHFSQRYPKIPAGIPAPGGRVAHGAACQVGVSHLVSEPHSRLLPCRTEALRGVTMQSDQGMLSMQPL